MNTTKRHAYEAQFKLQAIGYAEENGNRAAAREFQVNESMVRKWRKQESELRQVKKTKLSFRGNKARWPVLEDQLERWIHDQRAAGRSVSGVTIRRRAKTLAEELKIEHFRGGPSWCFRFMKRRHLTIRVKTTAAQQLPADYKEKLAIFRTYCSKKIADKRIQPNHITKTKKKHNAMDLGAPPNPPALAPEEVNSICYNPAEEDSAFTRTGYDDLNLRFCTKDDWTHTLDDLKKLRINELKDELQRRSLDTGGLKTDLVERLLAVLQEDTRAKSPRREEDKNGDRGDYYEEEDTKPQVEWEPCHSQPGFASDHSVPKLNANLPIRTAIADIVVIKPEPGKEEGVDIKQEEDNARDWGCYSEEEDTKPEVKREPCDSQPVFASDHSVVDLNDNSNFPNMPAVAELVFTLEPDEEEDGDIQPEIREEIKMEDALVAVGSAGWAEPNCGHDDGSLAVPAKLQSERCGHYRRKRPREENGDYNYHEHENILAAIGSLTGNCFHHVRTPTRPAEILPYVFDPESDEETEEQQQHPQTRTTMDVSEWCTCGNCSTMQTELENVCCRETPMVTRRMEEADPPVNCMTCHPGFVPVCLNIYSLQNALNIYRAQYGNLQVRGYENRFRNLAYRSFVSWCWGYLGKKIRVVIPSCVVQRIQRELQMWQGNMLDSKLLSPD